MPGYLDHQDDFVIKVKGQHKLAFFTVTNRLATRVLTMLCSGELDQTLSQQAVSMAISLPDRRRNDSLHRG